MSKTDLGKWKLEKSALGSECYFVAPKHYQFGEELRRKGVRNPTDLLGPQEQDVFPNFSKDLTSRSARRRERLELGAVMGRILSLIHI